jgi:Holliday junction DNA helicase RuvA
MFELLISVSGVGAKTAITMLSACEPTDFAIAVISEDINTLKQIPGVGAKSAQRIILELKDKIKKEQQISELTKASKGGEKTKTEILLENTQKLDEAIAALQVLGYNKKEIEKAFEKLETKDLSTEDLIRKGLSILGK